MIQFNEKSHLCESYEESLSLSVKFVDHSAHVDSNLIDVVGDFVDALSIVQQ